MLYCYTNIFNGLSGDVSQDKGLRYRNVGKMSVKVKETQELYQCAGILLVIHIISWEDNSKISGHWNTKQKKKSSYNLACFRSNTALEQMWFQTFLCLLAEITFSVFQLLITFCLLIKTPELPSREMCVYWGERKSMPMDTSFFYRVQVFSALLGFWIIFWNLEST